MTPGPPIVAARWPRRVRFVRLPRLGLSVRLDLVSVAITVALVLVTGVVAVWSLGASATRTPGLGFAEVLRVLTGQVSGSPADHVATWLPVVVTAVLGGASLALSGAIFQTLTRNPLGSPDILGFTTGANTGALVAMLVLGLGSGGATAGALLGCLATALIVYFLGMRGGKATIGSSSSVSGSRRCCCRSTAI